MFVQGRKFGEVKRIRCGFGRGKPFYRGDVSEEVIKFTLEMCESLVIWVREIGFFNGIDRTRFRRWERRLLFEEA